MFAVPDDTLLLARLMGQYCFAGCRLSSSVTLPAGGRAVRRASRRAARRQPDTWAVGRPTLHGGPVVLRPVSVTPCYTVKHFVKTHAVRLSLPWLRHGMLSQLRSLQCLDSTRERERENFIRHSNRNKRIIR